MVVNTSNKNSVLALLGGPAMAVEIAQPYWPPRNEQTAKKLLELYWRGNWSFGLDGQEIALGQEFAAAQGATHGIFMANGTVTIQCALLALGVEPGDEVIVPALTCVSSVMPMRNIGAKCVIVDVEPSTLCLDPNKVEMAITDKTKAVMPVHLYGSMVDMDAIMAIAKCHNLVVIEDAAHAHGGQWNHQGIGSIGDIGSFSFQQNKTMTCGEGGICITNNTELAERIYRIMHLGYAPGEYGTGHRSSPPRGLPFSNLSGTEFQALIIRCQLEDFAKQSKLYQKNAERLETALNATPGMRIQSKGRLANEQFYNKLLVLFDEEPLADIPITVLIDVLNAEGLSAARTFGAVYQHAQFNFIDSQYWIPEQQCLVSETIGENRGLVLRHQWLGTDDDAIDTIAAVFRKVSENADALKHYVLKDR